MKKIDLSQVLFTVVILIVTTIFLSSCNKEEDNSNLYLYTIEYVDDELGIAHGTTQEVNGSQTTTFYVTAPYSCISYDSISNKHYLDMDRYEASTDTLKSIHLSTYKLAGM